MEERYRRRHIVHDKDAISFAQILPAYAAIFLLACKIWQQQKNGVPKVRNKFFDGYDIIISLVVLIRPRVHVHDLTVAFACSIPELKCAVLVVISDG
jgi:hypothetical protein